MFVDFKQLARLLGIALLAFAIWLMWWCQAERQVRRAQGRLLGALESRDYQALARLMADDYRDGWDHDKAFVLRRCPEVFDQFVLLTVEGELRGTEETLSGWIIMHKLDI